MNERFEYIRDLGAGSSGPVLLCADRKTGLLASVKTLPGRQKHEPRILARLSGIDGVPRLLTVFQKNGARLMATEYIEGQTVGELLLNRGVLPPQEALEAVLSLLEILEGVHACGVIHRDICPDNLILSRRGAALIDFGSARLMRRWKRPPFPVRDGFSPPEQYLQKGREGPWTDVYASAALLYKLLSGVTPQAARERLVRDATRQLWLIAPAAGKEVSDAVMAALVPKGSERTRSAGLFSAALRR